MTPAVVIWLLTLSAGGEGFHAHLVPPSPVSLHQSYEECRVARDKRLVAYRDTLAHPIKAGPGWVQGGVVQGITPTASTQFYLLTCEAKRVQ